MRSLLRYCSLALVFFLAGIISMRTHADTSACPPTSTPQVVATSATDIAALPTAEAKMGTRKNPIPLGTVAHLTNDDKTEKYDLAIIDTMRGDKAWDMVHEGDMINLNKAPADNQEYIVLHLLLHYIDGPQDKAETFTSLFAIVGNNQVYRGIAYINSAGFIPQLYPGGMADGWTGILIDKKINDAVAAWSIDYEGTGGTFFALQ